MYKVEWSKKAQKDLKRIEPTAAKKIKFGVENSLAHDPTGRGKLLTHNHKGKWSFRFSDYRVIYQIKHNEILIIVVEVGHRREIYQKR
jgi:mRNA interferase RelE/StbE